MFTSSTNLYSDAAGSDILTLPLVDGPTNGKTMRSFRSAGVDYDFSIGHLSSNENPGFTTQRSVVRFAITKRDAITGKDYTAYAQIVLSIPLDMIPAADYNTLVAQLISFLFTGGGGSAPAPANLKSDILGVVTRLYAGEP